MQKGLGKIHFFAAQVCRLECLFACPIRHFSFTCVAGKRWRGDSRPAACRKKEYILQNSTLTAMDKDEKNKRGTFYLCYCRLSLSVLESTKKVIRGGDAKYESIILQISSSPSSS